MAPEVVTHRIEFETMSMTIDGREMHYQLPILCEMPGLAESEDSQRCIRQHVEWDAIPLPTTKKSGVAGAGSFVAR
eukprot:11281466-Heterocapsa_arctica.AAC.1